MTDAPLNPGLVEHIREVHLLLLKKLYDRDSEYNAGIVATQAVRHGLALWEEMVKLQEDYEDEEEYEDDE